MIENSRNDVRGTPARTPLPSSKSHELSSMLEIKKYSFARKIVIHLTGKLNTHTSILLQRELDLLALDQAYTVVLDMNALSQIDSAGIGILVSIFKQLQSNNRILYILGLQGQPYDIFKLLNLHKVIKIATSLEDIPDQP